jgi:hypothetical protein
MTFEKIWDKGMQLKPNGHSWSKNTVTVYADMIIGLFSDVKERFGTADISKVKPEMVDRIIQQRFDGFHSGKLSEAYNVKTLLAAI